MSSTFLKAEWRKLAMVNYTVHPQILLPYLPHGTELDFWQDRCYVSLIGFMFLNTKLKGIKIPFHSNFEEVNLRFYVRYKSEGNWKRGVVFIKEIVPKSALTFVANTLYGEHYETMKMDHLWQIEQNKMKVSYQWYKNKKWHSMAVNTSLDQVPIEDGSEEEFITEHFWGYTKLDNRTTSEYGVEHPRWNIYPILDYALDVDFGEVYGEDFSLLNSLQPTSVFLAEGSSIEVKHGRKI